jgi:hypothetical protein
MRRCALAKSYARRRGAGRSTSQATAATKDAASSFVSSREYPLKPLEKVY